MALSLMPVPEGLWRQQEVVRTNGLWSDLRGAEEGADEEEAELHLPTTQEMLQYELMRMTLDPEYRAQHPDFYQNSRVLELAKPIKEKQNAWALQNERDAVLMTVKGNGDALLYASEALKKDREFILAAVKQDRNALKYASEELQNDPEMLAAAGWV